LDYEASKINIFKVHKLLISSFAF